MSSPSYKILCSDFPSDFILDKNLAKDYFRQFGKLKRLVFKSKSRICTIEYAEEQGFLNALKNAGEYNGIIFSLSVAHKSPEAKKKKVVKPDDSIWVLEDEVQAELEAMSGVLPRNNNFATETTNSPPSAKIFDRSPKLKRVWQSEEPQKTKKKIKVLESGGMVITAEQMDLVNLILSQALNVEDRYRILDARDKLIRIKFKKNLHLKSSPTIGTCPDMCPEKERMMREAQHQVALFEQEDNSRAMNQCKAVKQYSRSSADQETPLPHELRPVPVLQMTMNYLLHNIVDLCNTDEVNLAEWFHFLWDRTRGIRKDITQQELCCQGAVALVEQCARFHIHCSARLVAEDPSVFDQKINTENLTKCLQTLKYMYHDLLLKGESCSNEAEFRAYIILLNISDGNFMWEVQQLREDIQKSVEVKFALEVYSAIDKNNYVKFFKLVYSTTYLNACILMRYFVQVRLTAIKTLLRCYLPRSSRTTYPLTELKNLLAFDDIESTVYFVQTFGLSVNEENTHVVLEKNKFATPDFPYVLDRSLNVVESKRKFPVGRVICGKELQPKIYENHSPQNSFDQKGFLVSKDILEEAELEQAKFKLLEELKGETMSSDEDSTKTVIPRQKPSISGLVTGSILAKKNDGASKIPEQHINPLSTSFKSSQSIFGNAQRENVPFRSDFAVWNKETPVANATIEPPIVGNIFSKSFESLVPTNAATKGGFVFKGKSLDQSSLTPKEKLLDNVFEATPTLPQKAEIFQATPAKPVEKPSETQSKIKEQAKTDEEEKQRIEFFRKENERKALEAKRKEEQLKELKKRKQEEELRRRMKEIQDEEILLDQEISKAVKDTIDHMINQVHSRVSSEITAKIRNSIKRRTALKVFRKWHNIVLKNKRKRKIMECSPAWINIDSFEESAEGLHIPSQNLSLKLIKRYKQGQPWKISLTNRDTTNKINIVELTYSALTKRLQELTGKFQKNIFWKVSVSLPDELELKQGSERIENVMNNVFQWKQENGRTLAVEQVKQDAESLTYCVEKRKGKVADGYDADGIIFVAKNFSYDLQRRIYENLKGFGLFTKTPIVIILQNNDNSEVNLNKLIEQKIVSEYMILVEKFTPCGLSNAIEDGLIFLANKVDSRPPLELDTFYNFMLKYLCSETWKRANSFARWNSNYKRCLQSPNVVIKLYNEGLERLTKIILDESLQEYAVFPKTFRGYLDCEIPDFLPCSYQYFPEFWNTQSYKKQLQKTLLALRLPDWLEIWPCIDELELEKKVLSYCCEAFEDSQRVFYKVMSVLLGEVDPEVNFGDISKVLWTDVIEVLGVEKIKEANTSLKGTTFEDNSIYNQLIVVYESSALDSYNSSDWFYIHNPLIKTFIKEKLEENEEQSEPEKIVLEDFETLEETLIAAATQSTGQKPNILKVKKELADLNTLLQDLEMSMEIHKRISSTMDENLKRAINEN